MENPITMRMKMSDEERKLKDLYLYTWMSGMQNVQSNAPAADPKIAVLAAAELMGETIRLAYNDAQVREAHLSHLGSIMGRFWGERENAA
jgi:hypothetical protein